MSVLVNGSATKDFKVERGLRQGDPISPFVFVLVTEALTCLMNKAVEDVDFRGFKINVDEEVNLLQFADDTIMVEDGSSDNLWSMKAIIRGFEMMSGLKINFNKSKLYEIHVGEWFLNATSILLSCNVDSLPLKFLGVNVGDSPRKLSIWRDLINHFKNRLARWKGKHLTVAGKVVLINSVLNVIHIYTLSFYKAPSKVVWEIRSIQSNFLWNGCESKRIIHWVK